MCNGVAQFIIMKIPFADDLFLTVDDNAKLPATVKLSRPDLARPPAPPKDKPTDPPGDWKGRQPVIPSDKPEL